MPIEFRCPTCQKLLRTPDEAAGKKARCPECGNIQDVPGGGPSGSFTQPLGPAGQTPSATFGETLPAGGTFSPQAGPAEGTYGGAGYSGTPSYGGGTGTPGAYGGPPAGGNPYADRQPPAYPYGNPYAAPMAAYPPRYGYGPPSDMMRQAIRNKVQAPAVALIVVSIVAMVCYCGVSLMVVPAAVDGPDPEGAIVPIGMMGVNIIINLVVLIGAIQMKGLAGYGMAMTAAILAVIPCGSCWLLTVGFGIWAIVVLADPMVRTSFR